MKLLSRTRRGVAAGLTGALVAGAFVGLAATPAHADAPSAATDGTATWGISPWLGAGSFGRPKVLGDQLTAPATWDAATKQASWGAASGSVRANGSAELSFDGRVVLFAGTSGATLYLSDLEADIDESGNGSVTAEVSYGSSTIGTPPMMSYDPAVALDRQPTRVEVLELVGNTTAQVTTTADSVEWDALTATGWSAELVDFLDGDAASDPVVPEFSYLSAFTNAAAERQPAPLTLKVSTAALEPTVTAELNAARDLVTVQGTNFVGGDENYQGVYIGIAESGGLPATGSLDNRDLFIASDWITAERIVDGAFTGRLLIDESNPDVPAIKPGVEYSVYTWQAHLHTTDALDTETRIGVLKDKPAPVVKKASKVTLKINKKANRKRAGKATVTVKGNPKATGRVVVKIKVPGVKKVRTVKVKLNKKGKATVKLVKAKKKGQYRVRVKYNGDKNWKASKQVTKKYRVKK